MTKSDWDVIIVGSGFGGSGAGSGEGFFRAGLVFFRASSLSRASLSKTKERSAFETNFFNMPSSFQALINTFKAPQ